MVLSPTDSSQASRELLQALAVQRMGSQERAAWWRQELAIVQAHTQFFMDHFPSRPGAVSFSSLAEKNHYDEARELEQALNHAVVSRASHAASSH